MRIEVLHKDCKNKVKGICSPVFEDLTRPKDPSIKLDHEFKVLKCTGCGLEISVHYQDEAVALFTGSPEI